MPALDLSHVRHVNLAIQPDGPWVSADLISLNEATFVVSLPDDMPASTLLEHLHVEFAYRTFWCRVRLALAAIDGQEIALQRPDEMDCAFFQRRAFERIDLETEILALPIAANGQQIGAPLPVRIKNLSAGGCLMASDTPLGDAGAQLMLLLALPGLASTTTTSEVVRVTETADGERNYGVKFKSLTFFNQQRVSEFVGSEIRRAKENGRSIVTS